MTEQVLFTDQPEDSNYFFETLIVASDQMYNVTLAYPLDVIRSNAISFSDISIHGQRPLFGKAVSEVLKAGDKQTKKYQRAVEYRPRPPRVLGSRGRR